MILGVISRNNGLLWGEKGMKVSHKMQMTPTLLCTERFMLIQIPNPPNPPFEISDSFYEITKFYDLPLGPFYEGFETKHDIFEWAASIRYFDSSRFQATGPGFTKVKPERTMYAEFVEWVESTKPRSHPYNQLPRQEKIDRIREDALVFFNKKKDFEDLAKSRTDKARLKDVFSGSRVRDWTGLGGYWTGVKAIMDEVRNRMGSEQGILEFLEDHTEDDLKAVVLQVQSDLGIKYCPPSHLHSSNSFPEKTAADREDKVMVVDDKSSCR